VVWGHLLMGFDLTMPSMVGFASLAGIVVNDSILLVEFIKLREREGQAPTEAACQASRDRFRAVLLTSLTTIAGLLPLLAERSMQAQFLIPLTASIVFGLMASTVLVLVVVPCLYGMVSDLRA
jgi:multidrug efflux pump subunit AcrB